MNYFKWAALSLYISTSAGLLAATDAIFYTQDLFSPFIKEPESPCDLFRSLSIAFHYAHMDHNQTDPVLQDALLGRLSRCVWCLRNTISIVPNNSDVKDRLNKLIQSIAHPFNSTLQQQDSLLIFLLSQVQSVLNG